MHYTSKRKKVRVMNVITKEVSTVDVTTAEAMVATGEYRYVESI